MTQTVSRVEEAITQLRHMLPTNTATPQAYDQHEHWEQIAMKTIDDGYFASADEFVRFVEACLWHITFEQIMSHRAYAIGVRNLADANAHWWDSGISNENTPTTIEIAGLLQNKRVILGHFRSPRPEFGDAGAERAVR